MWEKVAQIDGNSVFAIDFEKVLQAQQSPITIEILGITLPSAEPFTKNDFERDLGKACRRAKKYAPDSAL
jgi:hypothetical protein